MDTKKLVRSSLLLALALVFQIGFRNFAQPLVGPLVNMTLILTTLMVGATSGVFVGVFTPLIAFIVGIIAVPPLIPIIAIGNGLLVIVFNFFNNKVSFRSKGFISILLAAFIKFLFLTLSVRTILPLFMPKVPPVLIATFSLPQLYTALIGGSLALIIYPLISKHLK